MLHYWEEPCYKTTLSTVSYTVQTLLHYEPAIRYLLAWVEAPPSLQYFVLKSQIQTQITVFFVSFLS